MYIEDEITASPSLKKSKLASRSLSLSKVKGKGKVLVQSPASRSKNLGKPKQSHSKENEVSFDDPTRFQIQDAPISPLDFDECLNSSKEKDDNSQPSFELSDFDFQPNKEMTFRDLDTTRQGLVDFQCLIRCTFHEIKSLNLKQMDISNDFEEIQSMGGVKDNVQNVAAKEIWMEDEKKSATDCIF